ncbi:uncharacterized protein isoform X2 [Rhodnius prolixus]|uniref:uncharacterized protein isoform X2 n=1 Tax=Rhodnius prolixus TaxID=13249 RepID=UPI003D18D8ED
MILQFTAKKFETTRLIPLRLRRHARLSIVCVRLQVHVNEINLNIRHCDIKNCHYGRRMQIATSLPSTSVDNLGEVFHHLEYRCIVSLGSVEVVGNQRQKKNF